MDSVIKENEFYYYKVPTIKDNREKQIFIIKEQDSLAYYLVSVILHQHLQKNKLVYPIKSYSFQEQVRSSEYRTYSHNITDLDNGISCTQTTYDEFIKRFIPVCQEKFGTHQRIDISSGEMKKYWTSFVRMTILERIMQQIIKQSRNKDVFIILIMESLEEAIITDLQNEFTKINSRCNLFFINRGEFNPQLHLGFVSQIQKSYSTEQYQHKPYYKYEEYFSNKEEYQKNEYAYINEVMNDILPQLSFKVVAETEVEVLQYPWSKPTNKVFTGTVVLSKENRGDSIAINNTKNECLVAMRNLDVDQMIDIFSTWVNSILINYGLMDCGKEVVEAAIEFLTDFMIDYVAKINITNIPTNKPIENMTVRQRLIAQQSNRCRYQLILLIKSLTNLFLKDTIGDLNNEEELERQRIGTQVGKFHQRALVMRGLDVETFMKMKNFFIDELIRVKSTISYQSDQERSIFSLENMKDVFLQEDIVEGLREVKSQYHLISAFPLIGLGVKLQRSDGSMINPYRVQVLEIAKINANVDTISIQNTPDKELNLNAGFYIGAEYGTRDYFEQNHGYKQLKWTQYQPKKAVLKDLNETQLFYYKSEQLKERIDAVVPLFGPKDYDLRPLLSTSFFHVLMNFNVMHNVDTCFSEAYLALLANTLIFLLNQQKSSYIEELLDKIYHSVNIVYGERPFFKTYCELLVSQPRHAMVSFHEGHPTQCQDPSKALIILFYLVKKGEVTDQAKIKEILEAILQELVARGIKNLEKLHTYFGIVGYDEAEFKKIESDIINNVVGDVTQQPTIRQMMKVVENALKEKNYFEFTKKCKIFIYKDSFTFMNCGKLNFFTSMKAICQYFLPKEVFSGGLLWIWLLHAQKYPNNYTRNTSEMQNGIFKVYSNIKKQKNIYFIREESLKIYNSCYQILRKKYQEEMAILHMGAIPYSEEQILKLMAEDKKFTAKFNNVSNLTKNCCLSPKCPFFLKKMPNIAEHVKDIDCVIPGFHKTVKILSGKDSETIYEWICKGQFLESENMQEYIKQSQRLQSERVQYFLLKKHKEHYINLIEELCAQYKLIYRDEHKK